MKKEKPLSLKKQVNLIAHDLEDTLKDALFFDVLTQDRLNYVNGAVQQIIRTVEEWKNAKS